MTLTTSPANPSPSIIPMKNRPVTLPLKVGDSSKPRLHPRNRHQQRYDLPQLISVCPDLAPFVQLNVHGQESIDFANPAAVKRLNTALLKQFYGLNFWDIPEGYLCPPIPGRADYIHYMADVLAQSNKGKIPTGAAIRALDIGVGANAIYPIIGHQEYGWTFIGTDIDPVAIESAEKIIQSNPVLTGAIECRLQPNPSIIFQGILQTDEMVDLVVCNPPFHATPKEAEAESLRKQSNLKQQKVRKSVLNFGGQARELWCEGGEEWFVRRMVTQSEAVRNQVLWFSSLVAKQTHLKAIYEALRSVKADMVQTIPMGQGNKSSRLVAWTFQDKTARAVWREKRWIKKPKS
jgi:23S rRNA (adenine1618-N6)-methyltransferase